MSYRRRDDPNAFVIKNGVRLDNSYVVPYNRQLLLRYRAHINVEICSQSMLIKYLFKYITRGMDRARASLSEKDTDEIKQYLNCRCLCPYEAAWRLFEFSIHLQEPVV